MNQASESEEKSEGWFWQGRKMERLVRKRDSFSAEHEEYLARARMAFFEAKRLSDEPPFNSEPQPPRLALELLAESLYCSLVAIALEHNERPSKESLGEALELSKVSLDELVSDAAQGEALVEFVSRLGVRGALAVDTADTRLVGPLREATLRALERADAPVRGIELIWFQRLLRLGLPLLVLVIIGTAVKFERDRASLVADTTFPWTASSVHSEPGCASPLQACEQDHFFFCTRNDKNPSITFDLEKRPTVSGVTITNRTDCRGCSERAVPLVVEVSNDGEEWNVVAERKQDFVTWRAKFPRVHARFLRLVVQKRTYFHLKQVRIHP